MRGSVVSSFTIARSACPGSEIGLVVLELAKPRHDDVSSARH